MSNNQPETRVERDSMGPMEVPVEAYYGASTMRAVLNFPISNLRFSRSFIQALALIKGTAAEVNAGLGLLDDEIGGALARAAQEVAGRRFRRALRHRHISDGVRHVDEHERQRSHRP